MKSRSLLVPLIIIFIASFSFGATTGKIAGVVKDASTGELLPGANVTITDTQLGGATDIDGNYFIINIPPGVYKVTTTMMGYKKLTVEDVRVRIDQTTPLDVELDQEVISGEEVTVVAKKPVVDKYVTSTKSVINSNEIQNSYVTNVEQVLDMQQGVNYNGGIRGGFGNEVAYYVDGLEIRDTGSNSNYSVIPTSAIEEMQVMTGGYNAEYGQAMGGIVNIVTKTATDQIHGSAEFRYRPSGIYHWGDHIYGDNLYEYSIMSNPDYWEGINPGPAFNDLSNDEKARIWVDETMNAPWVQSMKDYDKRSDYEVEATLYGPIRDKLSFMVSGLYKRGASILPSLFKYNPEWHGEANLQYELTSNTKISFKGMYGGFNNSGFQKTNYASTEDVGAATTQPSTYVSSAFSKNKYYLLGSWGLGTMTPPEYVRMKSGSLKGTHTFSPSSFLEVKYDYFEFERDGTWRKDDLTEQYGLDPLAIINGGTYTDENGVLHRAPDNYPEYMQFNPGGMPWYDNWTFQSYPQIVDYAKTRRHTLSTDFTSQISSVQQIKVGGKFNYFYTDRKVAQGPHYVTFTNTWQPTDANPWEVSGYIQDRIETGGMIINLGLRLDMYNANMVVSDDIYDPAGIDSETPGNEFQNVISRGDPWNWERMQEGDPYSTTTPTQVAISPRVGVSHPITDNTVLHFMYGHFCQRPAWTKITPNAIYVIGNNHYSYGFPYDNYPFGENYLDGSGTYPNNRGYYWNGSGAGNPWLEYEKFIQYEVGFEQNILDKLRLDVTMYYKDGKNLTSGGIRTEESAIDNYGTYTTSRVRLIADRDLGPAQGAGKTGSFVVPQNNVWQDVRGLEFTLQSQLQKYFNARLDYNLSFSQTGLYGVSNAYRPGEDGTQYAYNTRFGANNKDYGNSSNNNENWNPNNSVKLTCTLFTPHEFGPVLGKFHPLGNFNVNFHYTWAQGRRYTYHSQEEGDFSTEPNNRRWEGYHNSNLAISRRLQLTKGINAIFSINVTNLFNQKQLRLPSNLTNWHEQGIHSPVTIGSGDYQEIREDEWRMYNFSQLPRMIYYNLGIEF